MDPNSPETIIGMLAVVLIPVISALVIKLQKLSTTQESAGRDNIIRQIWTGNNQYF